MRMSQDQKTIRRTQRLNSRCQALWQVPLLAFLLALFFVFLLNLILSNPVPNFSVHSNHTVPLVALCPSRDHSCLRILAKMGFKYPASRMLPLSSGLT